MSAGLVGPAGGEVGPAEAASLSTVRTLVRRSLHDEDGAAYRWTDAELNRHLARAVRELSEVWPREQTAALVTTPASRDVSLASLTDLVRIEAVEYPTAQWPPSYTQFSVWGTVMTLLVDGAPSSALPLNLMWGKVHALDDLSSTLTALAEEAVVLGAGAFASLEWASFASNRANIQGRFAFGNYEAWGREQLTEFRRLLGQFGRESRVRQSRLYTPARAVASKSTVQWEV